MRILVLLLMAGFCLGACGIKPGSVQPADGDNNKQYPATYPNPNTDP